MSSLAMRHGGARAAAAIERAVPSSGGFAAFFRALIATREAEARRRVATYLGACTDERLRDLDLSAEDIGAIRAGTFNGVRG